MRYKIYGNDLTAIPYVRNLNLTDDTGADDILSIAAKFWNSANRFYYDPEKEGKELTLILGSDKNEGLTLFSHLKGSSVGALKRICVLLPESHPLFNFTLIERRINKFVRSSSVSEINLTYFLKQIEDFII